MSLPSMTAAQPCQSTGRTKCEVWTRVMGYHRPVNHYNVGKKSEFYSRTFFKECIASNKAFVEQFSGSVA